MFKRVAYFLTSLALALVGSFAVSSPASAAAGDCATGTFCFWVDSNYSGPRYNLRTGYLNRNLQNSSCGGCRSATNSAANGTWNDMASSWYNRRDRPACIYTGANFTGRAYQIAPGGRVSFSSSFNDQVSSVRSAIYRRGAGTIPPGYQCF